MNNEQLHKRKDKSYHLRSSAMHVAGVKMFRLNFSMMKLTLSPWHVVHRILNIEMKLKIWLFIIIFFWNSVPINRVASFVTLYIVYMFVTVARFTVCISRRIRNTIKNMKVTSIFISLSLSLSFKSLECCKLCKVHFSQIKSLGEEKIVEFLLISLH